MTVRTLAGCVTAPRPCGRDRGRRRAVRFAAIAVTIVGAGLAAGAAWGGENSLVVLPVEPNPQVIAVYPEYRWPIVKVIDGDTIKVDTGADMPPELARLSVRLRGVDTPEKGGRAKCDAERRAGRAATSFTAAAVAGARTVTIRNLLIRESPRWRAAFSRLSLGAPASRRHRAKRERAAIGGSGVREGCGPSARHAGGTPALPDERSLFTRG